MLQGGADFAADATKSLRKNYHVITDALKVIEENENEKAATRHEAKALRKKIGKFEIAVLIVVWDTVLQRLNSVNKSIQTSTGNISVLNNLYDSLISFIQSVRDNFIHYEEEASSFVPIEYEQKRKNKSSDINLTARQSFITLCIYVMCDALLTELNKRKSAYSEIQNRFGF